MKKVLSRIVPALLCLVIVLSLAACGGSGDALKGTWTCDDADYGTVTFTFDGKGDKCTFENDFYSGEGTYAISGEQVTITSVWEEPKVYDFTAGDKVLYLTATDGLSPDYNLSKK